MKTASLMMWSPQNDDFRIRLTRMSGRHDLKKFGDKFKKRLDQRAKVAGKPLTKINMTLSVNETGTLLVKLSERHASIPRMLFYAPLLLLKGQRFPFFSTNSTSEIKHDLAEVERTLLAEEYNDLPF